MAAGDGLPRATPQIPPLARSARSVGMTWWGVASLGRNDMVRGCLARPGHARGTADGSALPSAHEKTGGDKPRPYGEL